MQLLGRGSTPNSRESAASNDARCSVYSQTGAFPDRPRMPLHLCGKGRGIARGHRSEPARRLHRRPRPAAAPAAVHGHVRPLASARRGGEDPVDVARRAPAGLGPPPAMLAACRCDAHGERAVASLTTRAAIWWHSSDLFAHCAHAALQATSPKGRCLAVSLPCTSPPAPRSGTGSASATAGRSRHSQSVPRALAGEGAVRCTRKH